MSAAARRSIRAMIIATWAMNVGFSAIAAGAAVAASAVGLSPTWIGVGGALSSFATVVGALWAGGRTQRVRAWCAALIVLLAGALASLFVGHDGGRTVEVALLVPLRLLDGFALGIALTVSETLLFARIDDSGMDRRRALAACSMATAVGFMAGPAFTAVAVVIGAESVAAAFIVAAAAAAATTVFVVATLARPSSTSTTPMPAASTTSTTTTAPTTFAQLVRVNRVPWSTTLYYGTFQGAALLALPLRLLEVGVDDAGAVAISAVYAAGMFVGTGAAARLGDRFGERTVMVGFCVVGGAAIVGVGTLPVQWLLVRAPLAFIAGATVASLSPLSLGVVGRANAAVDVPRATSIYNALYGLGNLIGPVLLALFVDVVGTGALLAALGVGFLLHGASIAVARATFTPSP